MGRSGELASLEAFLREGSPYGVTMLSGAGGVGKSRLVTAACAEASRSGWSVASGYAYPVESGVAYGLFSDAFIPVLSGLPDGMLTSLTRGGEAELRCLFPALGSERDPGPISDWDDPGEYKTRLLWNFVQLLKRLGERQRLLILLEDLQWADESSLELLHFAARHLGDHPVRILCTYNNELLSQAPALRRTEASLLAQGSTQRMHLGPLSLEEVDELVQGAFKVDRVVTHDLVQRLHAWTEGNPLFLLETLKSLVEAGRLRREDGVWVGWQNTDLELVGSLQEGILGRVARLSEDAHRVADLAAVVGGPASHRLLEALTDITDERLADVMEELIAHNILQEQSEGSRIVYDFTHPLCREALYGALGLARARLLHSAVARELERLQGVDGVEQLDLLAYHLVRSRAPSLDAKARRYLIAAGRNALDRHADVEAGKYLEAALGVLGEGEARTAPEGGSEPGIAEVLGLLAQVRQRQGRYSEALELWRRTLDEMSGAPPRAVASVHRAMGLVCYWSGRYADAIAHLELGLAVTPAEDERQAAVIRLARGVSLHELGASEEARSDLQESLAAARRLDDAPLLARAHRALALLHTWVGPPDEGRAHARKAIELAKRSSDLNVEFWSHWALEGLTGRTSTMADEIAACRDVVLEIRSPVLQIWTDELSIEHAYATGAWETGLVLGDRSIALARALNQWPLLPRLLVWTSLIHLGRGELEKGKELVDEAWTLAGLDEPVREVVDVHTAVPAHIGRAAYHLFAGDRERAIEIAEQGVALAERSGYVVWTIHHLLPIMAEALIHTRDLSRARRVGKRLRRDASKLEHALGLAWADACDAFVVWLSGDLKGGVERLRAATAALEAIPIAPDAARVRRQLAGRLVELGDREGALREIRAAHETMVRLGMQEELTKAREMFRTLGAKPPQRTPLAGSGDLTSRETQIARLVAGGISNKAIAKDLQLSVRTVTTHLQRVYKKLGISSRHQLAELVRQDRLSRD